METVLTDVDLYYGSYDLSGDSNQVELQAEAEVKDKTTYGDGGWRSKKAGLKHVMATFGGFWSAGDGEVDPYLWSKVGATEQPLTVAPTGVEGDVAYFCRGMQGRYQITSQVGELVTFAGALDGSNGEGLIRGRLMKGPTAITATGNGTGRQIIDVAADERLYAVLHVLEVADPTATLTVKVQSDDNSGFTTATDRITFTGVTAAGFEWATPVAGAITDEWWRLAFTVAGGSSPSFLIAAAIGIQ